jgi:uridylate kinase
MRVVFRIGGSVVASPVNTNLIGKYVDILKSIKQGGHEVGVVVGGGSLAREFITVARKLNLEMPAQDKVAISCSRLYAQLFAEKFGDLGCGKVAITLDEAAACLAEGKIAVMGGLKPGITTDTVAALVAERVGADLLVKGTDQEGIYNKDPRKFKDAVKIDHLRFDELQGVLAETEHKAGIHQIIDPEAVKVLSRRRVRLVVVNGFVPENFLLVVRGEKVGTLVN